jgi:hypothetical protein
VIKSEVCGRKLCPIKAITIIGISIKALFVELGMLMSLDTAIAAEGTCVSGNELVNQEREGSRKFE